MRRNRCGCDCDPCGCNPCCPGPTGPAGADGATGATGADGSFDFASAIVRRVSNLTIPPLGVVVVVPFEVTEYPNSFWNFGDPTKLTAIIGGKYNVTAQAIFSETTEGTGSKYTLHIRKNNGPNVATVIIEAATAHTATAIATTLVALNAGEYVEMTVELNDGGGSDLLSISLASPVFSISRVDN